MAVDERSRRELQEALMEAIGPEQTDTLLTYLPPSGWADVATARDVAALAAEFRGAMGVLTGELHVEVSELRSEFGALGSEFGALRGEFGALRGEFGWGVRWRVRHPQRRGSQRDKRAPW